MTADSKSPQSLKVPGPPRARFCDIWENPEVIANMAATKLWNLGKRLPEFILGKWPYAQALTLLMLLAERALKLDKYPPMHPKIIYTIAATCFLVGTMLSAKIKPKIASLIYVVLLGFLTYNAYTNRQFNYSKGDRYRISSRHLGCMGVYLIFAYCQDKTNSLLQRIGELCVGGYLLSTAYLINDSYEDKRAIMELLPGGHWMRYFLTVVFGAAGLCFVAGYFLRDISISMAFCLTFFIVLVDMRFAYWNYRGMMYWNQMRLVMDNLTMLTGFFLFAKHYEDMMPPSMVEEDSDEEEEEEEEENQKKTN